MARRHSARRRLFGDVLPGSHIDIYVNGNIAATVPITTGGGDILRHLPISVTMRHFRPGLNMIAIEAVLLTRRPTRLRAGRDRHRQRPFRAVRHLRVLDAAISPASRQLPNLAALRRHRLPLRRGPPGAVGGRSQSAGSAVGGSHLACPHGDRCRPPDTRRDGRIGGRRQPRCFIRRPRRTAILGLARRRWASTKRAAPTGARRLLARRHASPRHGGYLRPVA